MGFPLLTDSAIVPGLPAEGPVLRQWENTMKKYAAISLVLVSTACADVDSGFNISAGEAMGMVAGGFAGGTFGAEIGGGLGQMISVSIGALAGAGGGYVLGNMIDPSDQAAYNSNAVESLATNSDGDVSGWSNPKTGNSGIFTPTRSYVTGDGRYCRDYRVTLAINEDRAPNGTIARGDGTACQQADGSWALVKDDFG